MTCWGKRAAYAAVVCGAILATACSSGSNPTLQTPSASTSEKRSATSTASSSANPETQPALAAYLAFTEAATAAQRDPAAFSRSEESASAFTSVAFDPIRIAYIGYIGQLARANTAFRGTPSQPRVTVKSVALAAKPYPLVVLTDCPTPAPTWHAYEVESGKAVPDAVGSVPPPYELTIEVIKVNGRWGASKVDVDKSRTCTPA